MPPLTSLTARDEIGIINSNRQAKERLRVLIRSEDMDDAWAWTCKCIQVIYKYIFYLLIPNCFSVIRGL